MIPGQEPPCDKVAERAVIAAGLLSSQAYAEAVELVTGDDFFVPQHRHCWQAMAQVAARNRGEPEPMQVADAIKATRLVVPDATLDAPDPMAWLVDMMAALPAAENVRHYARIVRGKADLRRLIGACSNVIARAYPAAASDASGLVDQAMGDLMSIAMRRVGEMEAVGDMAPDVVSDIEERAGKWREGRRVGLATGIVALDAMLGPIEMGEQVVIAARPGVGKTALALQSAIDAVANDSATALVFSLEMPRRALVERILVRRARVDSQRVRRGEVDLEGLRALQRAAEWLRRDGESIPAFVDDRSRTLVEFTARARRWRARFPPPMPAMFVVDYVQLTKIHRARGQSKAEALGEVSQELKSLAKELDAVSMLCAQVNRTGAEAPTIEHLKDSGDLEQDADKILLLHGAGGDPDEPNVDCTIGKNRGGRKGTVNLRYVGRHYDFSDLGPEAGGLYE